MKQNQYQRIAAFLKRRPKAGATYHELMAQCWVNWPHKRLAEMEGQGYQFKKEKAGRFLRVFLVGVPT